jgi:hypothetical protein
MESIATFLLAIKASSEMRGELLGMVGKCPPEVNVVYSKVNNVYGKRNLRRSIAIPPGFRNGLYSPRALKY